jgi:4-hydroxy-tetrahydrodipicolinate reductase
MNILILGRGKTGALVAEVAARRKHKVTAAGAKDNARGAALSPDKLRSIDVVIDFTTPDAVLQNIEACIHAKKSVVVGTSGWHQELPRVKQMVEASGIGFLYGANFSMGINLFFDTARNAAAALRHGYSGQIFERHHAQKKDAPSATALALQKIIKESGGTELEVTSFREGDVVGMHELILASPNDTIYLCHDAKSRRGFAEGAVQAAEWLAGKKGFFDFREVWREM